MISCGSREGLVRCALLLCTCSCSTAPAQHRNATRVYTDPSGLTIDTRLMKMKYVHFHCKLNSRNDCSVHAAAFPKITKLAFAMLAICRGSYRPAYKLGSHNTVMRVIGAAVVFTNDDMEWRILKLRIDFWNTIHNSFHCYLCNV